MKTLLFQKRFRLLGFYAGTFLLCSFLLRIIFFIWVFNEAETSFLAIIKTLFIGALYDLGTVSFFAIPYVFYLIVMPNQFVGSLFDKVLTYFGVSIGLLLFLFSFFAEIAFWEEFQRRLNFIAVDYLASTHEVINNISESYSLPLLIVRMLFLTVLILYIFNKYDVFSSTFNNTIPIKGRLPITTLVCFITLFFAKFINNKDADWSTNHYNNELSKTGIYSFFAALKNNETSYTEFYKIIENNIAFKNVKSPQIKNDFIDSNNFFIQYSISNIDNLSLHNTTLTCIERLSDSFIKTFDGKEKINLLIYSFVSNTICFDNLFTRRAQLVRSMEAISLSITTASGRSIVKYKNYPKLLTIGEIFKRKVYEQNFFNGGDGYSNTMNAFFESDFFNITNHSIRFLIDSKILTKITNIENNKVLFEKTCGIIPNGLLYYKHT